MDTPLVPTKYHKFLWHPMLSFWLLLASIVRLNHGVTTLRIVGVIIIAIWFVLSIYDKGNNHRLLKWIYSKDE